MTLLKDRPTVRHAGWLPGLRDSEVEQWDTLVFGSRGQEVRVLAPRLTPAGLAAAIGRACEARDGYLAHLPVARVVTLLDRVASRWLDPASPYRLEAERLLPVVTGYAEEAVRKGLASHLSSLREANLRRLLEEELPDSRALDTFVARKAGGGETRAFGPRLTVHIWSGNVPGLPTQSLVNALLVKAACVGKVASEEPLFATLLAESIAEVDERLAACLAVVWWRGGDEQLEETAFQRADAVIAYGAERTVESIRSRVPLQTRFIAYGHKLSFGVVAREALADEHLADTADRAAYDIAKYDQQGCLSPHLLYVERGGTVSARAFADSLGEALAQYAVIVPRGHLSLEEAQSAAGVCQRYELREAAGEPVAVLGAGASGWAVLYDEDEAFEASCLNRVVSVKPVLDMSEVPRLVEPVRRFLQTCGVAASPDRRRELAGKLGELGLDRVCPLGRMADAAATWHHDGRFNLLELLRWTDLEPDASAGRWEFAHPQLGLYGR